MFGRTVSTTLNQDEAVSRGCALQCAMLSPAVRVRDFSVTDIQPYPLKLTWDPTQGEDGYINIRILCIILRIFKEGHIFLIFVLLF